MTSLGAFLAEIFQRKRKPVTRPEHILKAQ